MDSMLIQINANIEETYIKAYKLILNMNDLPVLEDIPLPANKLQGMLKPKSNTTSETILQLEKEKAQLSQEIKALNDQNSKYLKELNTLSKEIKNNEAKIEDTMSNFDWDRCKKSLNGKKFTASLLIPIMAIMFNRILSDEEIMNIFKQKYFPTCIASKELKFNTNFSDIIKQHLSSSKIPNDEMYVQISLLNQQINKNLENSASYLQIEGAKQKNRLNSENKELQLKVCNDMLYIYKPPSDGNKFTTIINQATKQIEEYNKKVSRKGNKDDRVIAYYRRLLGTIEKDRDELTAIEGPKTTETKPLNTGNVSIEKDQQICKKNGFFSFISGCC